MKHLLKLQHYLILSALSICLCLSAITKTYAQGINDDFFKFHLAQNIYPIDSEASAVVLYEKNTIDISRPNFNFVQSHRVYKIIKLLKADAFHLANISINYYGTDNSSYYVDLVKGATYNLENGQVVKTDLSKADVYTKKISGDIYSTGFSLPAIKEGSVIEYSYEEVTPVTYSLPRWNIQESYPKLESVYELSFPNIFQFTSFAQTRIPFKEYDTKGLAELDSAISYHVATQFNGNNDILWVRRNISATKDEPYISSIVNHTERVELQLTSIRINGMAESMVNTWDKFDKEQWGSIGQKLTASNSFLDDITDSLIKSCSSDIDKAKAIFKYARSTFTASNEKTVHARKVLKNAFEDKAGTEAEINLLLAAMMRKAGLNASPVVLSTVGSLQAKELFPVIDRFNYIICAVKIDSSRILLDASNKYNSFNTLPPYCYNGYARLIDKKGESLMLTPNAIKEKWVTYVRIADISDTAYTVNVTEKLGNVMSAQLREKWAKNEKEFKSYVHEQTQDYPGTVDVTKSDVLFLDNPDTNLVITYNCHVENDRHNSIYYMNTNFIKFFKGNPFKAMERQLPVEFPFKMDYMCAMAIQLPKEFKLEELPKPVEIDYENGEIMFKKMADYNNDLHWLTVNTHFVTNQTVYPVDNYATLRQFFDEMIQEENDIVTLKKVENK